MSRDPASSTDNTLQRLRRQAGTSRLYALIDPSQDERWQLSCDELELAIRQFRIIANPFIDLPPWRRLYLKPLEVPEIDIPRLVAQQRSRLPTKRTEPSGFCAWVTSPVLVDLPEPVDRTPADGDQSRRQDLPAALFRSEGDGVAGLPAGARAKDPAAAPFHRLVLFRPPAGPA